LIEVSHLTKKYGSFIAVNDISFTVEKGRIYGFLGPNGAGKSTTMNIITGCLAATSGEVRVNGHDIYEEPVEAKASIGYLPEQPPLYTDMTVEEFLCFVGEARGISPALMESRLEEVMQKTSLTGVRDRLIRNLSKGFRQRVGIAQAILADPEIIILDEPTVGLDPLQIIEIRELIRELGRDHTVILSSHILSEISAVCDHIIIISCGHVVASDTVENLTASADGQRQITAEIRATVPQAEAVLAQLQGAIACSVTSGLGGCARAVITEASDTDLRDDIFRLFAANDLPIISMNTNDVTLEDVFLRLTDPAAVEAMFMPAAEENPEDEDDGSDEGEEETEEIPDAEEEADTAEEEDSPYYEPAKKQKKKADSEDEEYRPLFGKKQ